VPVAVTVNVAGWPEVTAVLAGWRMIAGAVDGGWNDGTGWTV
jgi:hypothetical protein